VSEETQLRLIVNIVWILWTIVFVASWFYPYIAVAFFAWRYIASVIINKPWREEEDLDE